MPLKLERRIIGFVSLVAVPLAFLVWAYFLIPEWGSSNSGVLLLMLILYVLAMVSEVSYEPRRVRRIDMSELPEDVRDIITTTTLKGDYINLQLIRAFKDNRKLSQTDLFKEVTGSGTELTQPAVREYIVKLEQAGLIFSPPSKYAKEYSLTEKGRWCQIVISRLFPRRYWSYLLRNDLGIRRIPKFQQSSDRPS